MVVRSIVNNALLERVADNLALRKHAVQLSNYFSSASAAVDGDTSTASCTAVKAGYTWWTVDLGDNYYVGTVVVISPDVNGQYRNINVININIVISVINIINIAVDL